jgi:hypothetical protein
LNKKSIIKPSANQLIVKHLESFYNDSINKKKHPLTNTMISPVLSDSNQQQQQFNGLLTYANSTSNLNTLQDDIIEDVIETIIKSTKTSDHQPQSKQQEQPPSQQQQQQKQQQSSPKQPPSNSFKSLNINIDESLANSPNNQPSTISPASTIMTTTSEINNIDINDHKIQSQNTNGTETQLPFKIYKRKTNVSAQ